MKVKLKRKLLKIKEKVTSLGLTILSLMKKKNKEKAKRLKRMRIFERIRTDKFTYIQLQGVLGFWGFGELAS